MKANMFYFVIDVQQSAETENASAQILDCIERKHVLSCFKHEFSRVP